jgi:Fe-S oxidoreductase
MLRHLEDVADHCTICHKCLKPCPVDIDTGEVSILEREILVAHGYKHTAVATQATLRYLESRSPAFNAVFRAGVVQLGGKIQRLLANPAWNIAMLRSPVPPADPKTLRDVLPACEAHQALVLEPEGEAKHSVFYFPGCGSERLFSTVSMAALHVLLELGVRVVLPPPFLCCGFPHKANARTDQHGRIVLRDSIVFSQIREMFAYLRFDAVIVTCGTCRESLGQIEAGKIFGAPVHDVARFAAEHGLTLTPDGAYLYHTPCHDSLDGKAAAVLERIGKFRLATVPHCCSEAGTLALSRPDISDAMLHRKAVALKEALAEHKNGAVLLTNCPSCLQGLGRSAALGATPRHIAVELAQRLSGNDWPDKFRSQAARAQAFNF